MEGHGGGTTARAHECARGGGGAERGAKEEVAMHRGRAPSLCDHRHSLDLHLRAGLEQPAHNDDRHRRVVASDDLAVGGTDRAPRAEIVIPAGDEPGQSDQLFRARSRCAQHRHDVPQRLRCLRGEVVARERVCRRVPANLPGGDDDASGGGHAMRVAVRRRPTGGGDGRRTRHLAHRSLSRRRKRWSLPVAVRGSASTNSTWRGYLYGAISRFTKSWSSFATAGLPTMPSLRTTNAVTTWPRSSSGNPTTAQSRTCACSSSTFSTSGPEMLYPPEMIMSSVRAWYQK